MCWIVGSLSEPSRWKGRMESEIEIEGRNSQTQSVGRKVGSRGRGRGRGGRLGRKSVSIGVENVGGGEKSRGEKGRGAKDDEIMIVMII
jgi:hypothetical protein